jgi:hypothetical protein
VTSSPTHHLPSAAGHDRTMAEPDTVHMQVSQHCEVVVRARDECTVLDHLAAWTRQHRYDIEIVGLQWRTDWVPDPHPTVDGDEVPEYSVTMQFKTGAQRELNWEDCGLDAPPGQPTLRTCRT